MKRYELIVTQHGDGPITFETINCGFNGLELLGILEAKKQDIVNQVTNEAQFNRIVEKEHGYVKIEEDF